VASATGTYIQEVARLLNQNKVFPHASVEREEEGRVLIGLTLGRDGAVLDARVEEHSPFDRLNQAALQTVHNVTHFPAIPELVPAPLHLHVPLLFQIERR
jgi:TonB family protein